MESLSDVRRRIRSALATLSVIAFVAASVSLVTISGRESEIGTSATAATMASCQHLVWFHKRSAPYCISNGMCTVSLRAPDRIRPSAAADRSAAEILRALIEAGCAV